MPATRHRPRAVVADLLWTATPLTLEQARALLPVGPPPEDGRLPLTDVCHAQAQRLAAAADGRLPTSEEWEWMAGGGTRRYPWGDAAPDARHANLRMFGPGRPTPVGTHPHGATPHGLMDVAGNVWEWTATPRPGGGAVIRGGSYNSIAMYAECAYANDAPAALLSPGIGVRLVREP